MQEVQGPLDFVNWINGVSFASGFAASLLIVLLSNKRGDWVWRRELDRKESECAKEAERANRWENMVLELMGLTEGLIQETATELRTRRPPRR
jgi:hypothetical protein